MFGHAAGAFPGLEAVRTELLHRDANDRPGFRFDPPLGPVDYCAGFQVFWEVPFDAALPDPDTDFNREHGDLLLAFPTADAASTVFQRFAVLTRAAAAVQQDPERRVELLDAARLGEESLAGSITEFDTAIDADGTQREEPNVVVYGVVFRRGPVLVLSSDQFSPDAADFVQALNLATALDLRIAAARA